MTLEIRASDRARALPGAMTCPAPCPVPTPSRARAGRRFARIAVGLLANALLMAAAATATAQTMVSVAGDTVNMRAGAGTRHAVQWQLARGYPLRVLAHRNGWVQVEDFEGDRGWVLARLTGRQPHTVVKVSRANLRSAPSTRAKVVGQLGYGEVLRTLERRSGWLRVRDGAGRSGWVARRLLWGW